MSMTRACVWLICLHSGSCLSCWALLNMIYHAILAGGAYRLTNLLCKKQLMHVPWLWSYRATSFSWHNRLPTPQGNSWLSRRISPFGEGLPSPGHLLDWSKGLTLGSHIALGIEPLRPGCGAKCGWHLVEGWFFSASWVWRQMLRILFAYLNQGFTGFDDWKIMCDKPKWSIKYTHAWLNGRKRVPLPTHYTA